MPRLVLEHHGRGLVLLRGFYRSGANTVMSGGLISKRILDSWLQRTPRSSPLARIPMSTYMKIMKSLAELVFDFVIPGPTDGKNGELRSLILRLEEQKRDCHLEPLFEIHRRSPVHSAWFGLATIAYEIVRSFRPRRIVELGSFGGFSACAMALALRDLGEGGKLQAVDTWQGDPLMDSYDWDEVYDTFLQTRNALGLDDTIVPLRMSFDQASQVIEPGINLLHIDGWHTYRAVSKDFHQFKPLLAPAAIVMFHDVYSPVFREMRLFWRRISLRYPSVLIPYSSGLGIIQVP